MSSLSTSLYGSTTNKGVGGLLSGLDTDELVNQMTAATRNKINRQYQSKQKLLYRQEAYREVSTKLLSFSNKYFSYASGSKTNILSPKFFESYTFKSSSNYVNVTGNAENIKNFTIDSIESVATAASFTSSKRVSSDTIESLELTDYTSAIAGGTMTIEYEGKNYSLTIDKGFGNSNTENAITLQDVTDQINEQLDKINELSNLTASYDGNLITISSSVEGKEVKLTAASNSIISNLKFEVGKTVSSVSDINVSDLTKGTASILANKDTYITFDYNGVLKKINLDETVTKSTLKDYLQTEINNAYGAGKITVDLDTNNKLSFTAENGDTNIFGISSISSELSNFLDVESGDYNRLNRSKPLAESGLLGIGSVEKTTKDGEDYYNLKINNANIEFKSTMSVTDVINTINSNAEAGVRIYYSATTDTFTVKATEAGSHKGVDITAGSNTLAQALFGTGTDLNSILKDTNEYIKTENGVMNFYGNDGKKLGTIDYNKETRKYTKNYDDENTVDVDIAIADYHLNKGTDTLMTYTLNGVKNTISRSTANFTIDEINIELNEKASTIDFTNKVTFDVTNNSDEVVEKVKQFITEYNEIINLIGTKTSEKPKRDYLPLTPEQQDEMEEEEIKNWNEEAKKGVLYGDSKMNAVLRRMRETMSGLTDVSSITLSSIGISSASMDTSGKLVLDEKKFKEKLLENPDEIANLFTLSSSKTSTDARSGISLQLQKILRDNVGAYGTTGLLIEEAGMPNSMTSDRNYISEKMKEHDTKMTELKRDLEAERKRYWNQFSALESSLNKLNAQSSWLTDMMGQ